MLALTLLFWAGVFVTGFSALLFDLVAGLCFFVAVTGYLFGVTPEPESLRTLIIGFCVFLVPHIAQWLLAQIALLKENLSDFIRS